MPIQTWNFTKTNFFASVFKLFYQHSSGKYVYRQSHQGIKYNAKALLEKVSKLTVSEFSSLVKRCRSICQQDLCLPKDIRSKFGSFDFTDDDPLELWKYSEPFAEEFYGDAEKYYMNFLLFPQKFEVDIPVTNILLPEIAANYLLIHYAKSGRGTDNSKNDCSNRNYSALTEWEIKSLQFIAGYVIQRLCKRFKFT